MEEATSWKNHSFTLSIFGGIIVLCAIFFALGMVVGRGQGRQIAQADLEERLAKMTPAETASDSFKFDFPKDTTGERPQPTLRAAEPQAAPREQPTLTSSNPMPAKVDAPPASKPPAPAVPAGLFLQVAGTKNEKQAQAELKKVKSKGFEAKIVSVIKDNAKLYRVLVGPYKESEISLAKKDLQAKGFKGAFVAK